MQADQPAYQSSGPAHTSETARKGYLTPEQYEVLFRSGCRTEAEKLARQKRCDLEHAARLKRREDYIRQRLSVLKKETREDAQERLRLQLASSSAPANDAGAARLSKPGYPSDASARDAAPRPNGVGGARNGDPRNDYDARGLQSGPVFGSGTGQLFVFATEQTCVKALEQREQASWQEQPLAPTMNNLKPTENYVVSFRGVGAVFRRFLLHDPNPNSATMVYNLRDSESPSETRILPDNPTDSGSDMNWNIAVPEDGSTYFPHGPVYVGGRTIGGINGKYVGYSWMWLDGVPAPEAGAESTFNFEFASSAQVVNSGTFEILAFNGGVPKRQELKAFAALEQTFSSANIDKPDYFALVYNEDPNADGVSKNFPPLSPGIKVTANASCSVLRHIQVDQAYPNITQLGTMCIRAASIRFTDMAAPLEIQGEATVANVRELRKWWDMYTVGNGGANSVFKEVVAYRTSYLGPLRLGGYAYHLPRSFDDFVSKPCINVNYNTGTVVDVWWDIMDNSIVNVYAARSINTGTNDGMTGQGCDAWLTVVTHMDWTTDNKWPTADFVDVAVETWTDALTHLRFVPRAMSNKYHTKELFSSLFKKGQLLAKRYFVPFMKVAGTAVAEHMAQESPLAARGIKLLGDAYGIGNEITSTLKGGGM